MIDNSICLTCQYRYCCKALEKQKFRDDLTYRVIDCWLYKKDKRLKHNKNPAVW